MVVVKVDGEPVSLLVDQVGDVLELDSEQFGPPPPTLEPASATSSPACIRSRMACCLSLDVDLAVRV